MDEIAYDPAKRRLTLDHRGLDMARAGEVFNGPTFTLVDDRRDYGEPRFISAGFLDGRMVVVVWTPRHDAVRVISMRKANEREREKYRGRLGGS